MISFLFGTYIAQSKVFDKLQRPYFTHDRRYVRPRLILSNIGHVSEVNTTVCVCRVHARQRSPQEPTP